MTDTPSSQRLASDLDELATFRSVDSGGWTRTVFSEPYRASRDWVRSRMVDAGLDVREDAAGNLVGILAGRSPAAPALMTGSHTDTVESGGRFDGTVGVLGAIEAARLLRERGIRLNRDLVVVDFLGEEPNEYGLSCLGSRALSGDITPANLDQRDRTGASLGERLTSLGIDPAGLLSVDWPRRRRIHRYVELHVEQGPVLEQRGTPIGVVTAIVGIERLLARFVGQADHAGTMPMGDRRDALVAAAEAVLAIRREGCGAPVPAVATTSRVDSLPGSPNVVPSAAGLHAELRSADPDWLSAAKRRLAREIRDTAASYGVTVDLDWWCDNQYRPASVQVQDAIVNAAQRLQLSWEAVPSGATHDAVHIGKLCPMGMIFIPSRDGRSHCPEEFTAAGDIAAGVEVLTATLQELDTW